MGSWHHLWIVKLRDGQTTGTTAQWYVTRMSVQLAGKTAKVPTMSIIWHYIIGLLRSEILCCKTGKAVKVPLPFDSIHFSFSGYKQLGKQRKFITHKQSTLNSHHRLAVQGCGDDHQGHETHMKGGKKSASKFVITDHSRAKMTNQVPNAQKDTSDGLIKFQIGNKTKKTHWYQLMDLLWSYRSEN